LELFHYGTKLAVITCIYDRKLVHFLRLCSFMKIRYDAEKKVARCLSYEPICQDSSHDYVIPVWFFSALFWFLLPITYLETSSTAWITVVANVFITEV